VCVYKKNSIGKDGGNAFIYVTQFFK